MSYARSAFRVLGIAETDDARAIKRAYAAKLKGINADEDVAGFLALREALDTATYYARNVAAQAEAGDDDDDYYDEDADWTPPLPSAAPRGDADASGGVWDADAEMATQTPRTPTTAETLIAALQAEEEAFPDKLPFDADVSDALMAAYEATLADPAYETVDGQEDLERWLAHVLPQFAPWADGLLWRASYHFGWEAELEKAQGDWQFAYAAQRARDVGVVVQLMRPEDPGHAAFMALSMPPEESVKQGQNIIAIREKLVSFQYYNSAILDRLNPETLKYWSDLKPLQDCCPPHYWQGRSNVFFLWLMIALSSNFLIRVIYHLAH